MKHRSFFFIALFSVLTSNIHPQLTLNIIDSLGFKQGEWREFKIPFNVVTEPTEIKVPQINSPYYILTKDKDRKYFPIIECVGSYKDGLRNGIWEEFYSNSKTKSIVEYKNGVPSGVCKMFWENGKIKMECVIPTKGNFPIIIYNEDGTVLSNQEGNRIEVIKSIYEN